MKTKKEISETIYECEKTIGIIQAQIKDSNILREKTNDNYEHWLAFQDGLCVFFEQDIVREIADFMGLELIDGKFLWHQELITKNMYCDTEKWYEPRLDALNKYIEHLKSQV